MRMMRLWPTRWTSSLVQLLSVLGLSFSAVIITRNTEHLPRKKKSSLCYWVSRPEEQIAWSSSLLTKVILPSLSSLKHHHSFLCWCLSHNFSASLLRCHVTMWQSCYWRPPQYSINTPCLGCREDVRNSPQVQQLFWGKTILDKEYRVTPTQWH